MISAAEARINTERALASIRCANKILEKLEELIIENSCKGNHSCELDTGPILYGYNIEEDSEAASFTITSITSTLQYLGYRMMRQGSKIYVDWIARS